MATLTLAVPDGLKKDMELFPEMNWSEIARSAIRERVVEYKVFRAVIAKSKLSEKDALDIGAKVNDGVYNEYKKRLQKR